MGGQLAYPNETFLIECFPLESSDNTKSRIILYIVDDVQTNLVNCILDNYIVLFIT